MNFILMNALCVLTKIKNMIYCICKLSLQIQYIERENNMKKLSVMLAMIMALVMLLSATACGASGSWGSQLDKLCDGEDEVTYVRYSKDFIESMDMEDEIEELIDERLDGGVVKYYVVDLDDDYCFILEFEEAADAKMVAEFIEDEEEFFCFGVGYGVQDVERVARKGKSVVYGEKGAVRKIAE